MTETVRSKIILARVSSGFQSATNNIILVALLILLRLFRMKLTKRQDGFSLVELMIVVAVLAILAAIAIPSYLGIQKRAARSEAKSNLQALSLALEGYMAENNDYGAVNTYTYFGGSFGGDLSNLANITQLGNNILYEYQIKTFASPSPSYTILAVPQRGIVEGDITIWLDSNGDKGPPGAGW